MGTGAMTGTNVPSEALVTVLVTGPQLVRQRPPGPQLELADGHPALQAS